MTSERLSTEREKHLRGRASAVEIFAELDACRAELAAATARAERAEAELAEMRKLANREGPLGTVDILPAPAQPRRDPFVQQPAAVEPAGEGE